jgi:hypothetical protein
MKILVIVLCGFSLFAVSAERALAQSGPAQLTEAVHAALDHALAEIGAEASVVLATERFSSVVPGHSIDPASLTEFARARRLAIGRMDDNVLCAERQCRAANVVLFARVDQLSESGALIFASWVAPSAPGRVSYVGVVWRLESREGRLHVVEEIFRDVS